MERKIRKRLQATEPKTGQESIWSEFWETGPLRT